MKNIKILKICTGVISLFFCNFLGATYQNQRVPQNFGHAQAPRAPEVHAQPQGVSMEERSQLLREAKSIYIPFSEMTGAQGREEGAKQLFSEPLYQNLTRLDVSGERGRDPFSPEEVRKFKEILLTFFKNPNLQRLTHITANDTPMDLEMLKAISDIPADPFFRSSEGISWRDPSRRVVDIRVEVRRCPFLSDKWREITKLEDPEREVSVIYDADDERSVNRAYMKLYIATDD